MKQTNFTENEITKLRELLTSGNIENIGLVEELCSNEIGLFQELLNKEYYEIKVCDSLNGGGQSNMSKGYVVWPHHNTKSIYYCNKGLLKFPKKYS